MVKIKNNFLKNLIIMRNNEIVPNSKSEPFSFLFTFKMREKNCLTEWTLWSFFATFSTD